MTICGRIACAIVLACSLPVHGQNTKSKEQQAYESLAGAVFKGNFNKAGPSGQLTVDTKLPGIIMALSGAGVKNKIIKGYFYYDKGSNVEWCDFEGKVFYDDETDELTMSVFKEGNSGIRNGGPLLDKFKRLQFDLKGKGEWLAGVMPDLSVGGLYVEPRTIRLKRLTEEEATKTYQELRAPIEYYKKLAMPGVVYRVIATNGKGFREECALQFYAQYTDQPKIAGYLESLESGWVRMFADGYLVAGLYHGQENGVSHAIHLGGSYPVGDAKTSNYEGENSVFGAAYFEDIIISFKDGKLYGMFVPSHTPYKFEIREASPQFLEKYNNKRAPGLQKILKYFKEPVVYTGKAVEKEFQRDLGEAKIRIASAPNPTTGAGSFQMKIAGYPATDWIQCVYIINPALNRITVKTYEKIVSDLKTENISNLYFLNFDGDNITGSVGFMGRIKITIPLSSATPPTAEKK